MIRDNKYVFVNESNVSDIKTADQMNWEDESSFRSYIAYHKDTPVDLIRILEAARKRRARIRVFLGDVKTGCCWHEMYDTMGRIGVSMGIIRIPLLIKSATSSGGSALLDNCIIQITEDKRVLYKNPSFKMDLKIVKSKVSDLPFEVYDIASGKNVINVATKTAAKSMIEYFSGRANRYKFA